MLWIERRLDELLAAPAAAHERVPQAMRYATLGPGKRLRPVLAIVCTEALGGDPGRTMDAACAIEMVHAASLILDDLPCMDDAVLRRHRPTVHRAFGEDIALLAAIGLLARAVAVVAGDRRVSPAARGRLAAVLGRSVGCDGLVGGQELDLRGAARRTTSEGATDCNRRKTGALFEAAAEVAAISCGAPKRVRLALQAYGREFGCALQARDDLDDATTTSAVLGKDVRQDVGRRTLVEFLGDAGTAAILERHLAAGHQAVEQLKHATGSDRADLLHRLIERAFGSAGRPARTPARTAACQPVNGSP